MRELAIQVAEAHLGRDVHEMTTAVSAGGMTVVPATVMGAPVKTLVSSTAGSTSVIAVLDRGQSEATFDLGLEPGVTVEEASDGTLTTVARTQGHAQVLGVIGAPWAKDAGGMSLPTTYEVRGNRLVQKVDTAGAKYPIVADPTITGIGYWGPFMVAYVQFSRHETRLISQVVANQGYDAAINRGLTAYVCDKLPPRPQLLRSTCKKMIKGKYADLKENAVTAAREGKCLKARFPIITAAYPALDYYRKRC